VAKFRFGGIFLWFALFCGFYSVACKAQEKRHPASYYFRVGDVFLEKHNWIEARKAFDACLRQDPMYADAYYSRAIVNEHFDSLNQALTDYNIYLEFRPDHHEALFSRAQVRMRLDQNDLAKQDLLKLKSLPPGETTAIFYRTDAYTGAVDQIFTSKGKGADKAYIYNAIGIVDIKLTLYDEAIMYFDSALHFSPNDPDVLVNRGTAKEKKADTVNAIIDYQRALRLNPQHGVAKHNLGVITKGKIVGLSDERMLDEAIEDNPNMPYAYSERGYLNFKNGNYKKALGDYDRAIKLDPKEPEYFLNRGLIKEKLKDVGGAYDDYTKAIDLDPEFEKAWLNRGNLLAKLGKLNEAVEDYSVAIIHSPEYGSAFFNRAMAFNRLQQRDLACRDMHTAERLGVKVEPKVWKSVCN
jgi:tetratricopeptide (TPR) repeat protein